MRVDITITLDPLNIELCEWEDLNEISMSQIFFKPNYLAVDVYDASILIYEVTFIIYLAAKHIDVTLTAFL